MNINISENNRTIKKNEPSFKTIIPIVTHPHHAVTHFMRSPRPLLISFIFLGFILLLTSLQLPSILSGTQDALQTSSLTEHLTPEEYTSLTQLTPLRRTFASALLTFFSFASVVFQGFIVYLLFALARFPGLYREYFTATIIVSFYDTLLPILLSLLFPFVSFSALNLSTLPGLPPMVTAFLQPIDLFTVLSLVILGIGISTYANQSKLKTGKILCYYLLIRTLFFGSINLFFF